jgi:hypothetical protein
MKRASLRTIAIAVASCGPKGPKQPTHTPTVPEVVDHLAKARAALSSFRGDSTMDYWLSGQRAKGEVLVMGTVGRKVRFAALSPAGGSTLAEMACDGANFVYVDYQNNCALTGPCDAKSVALFFGIELEPDDFLHLALGTPPVIGNATGAVSWDSNRGAWKVDLHGEGGTQKLSIDGRSDRFDVLDSELAGADGKTKWSVANTDYKQVKGSGEWRVPGKSRFKSPAQSQDLLVEWSELETNAQLPPNAFELNAPAGLATCGQQAPAKTGPAAKPAPTKTKP